MNALRPELVGRKKINIGCGYDHRDNYLNIDVDESCNPDLLVRNHDLSVLPQRHYEEVLAHDVLEHIPHAFTMSALLDWAALLENGGRLVLQTSYLPGVVEQMKKKPGFETEYNWMRCLFGNQAHSGDFHHICFTESTLRAYLTAAGFSVSNFSFIDLWLINCTAIKVSDYLEFVRMDLDGVAFVQNAFKSILKRVENDATVAQLAEGMQDKPARISFVRQLISSPENLYKIGAKFDASFKA